MIDHEQDIWACSVRYALSRKSYIVDIVADFITMKKDVLTDRVKENIIRDIEMCNEEQGFGSNNDRKAWLRLLEKLKK